MIISLFGPDGAGKSTVTKRLIDEGITSFSGTGVASWPDQTWHNELVANGIDEASYDNEAHFLEKIRRCHALAREIEEAKGTVLIDSDPFHKTLMHDALKSRDRFDELMSLVPDHADRLHILVTVSGDDAAQVLQNRINARGYIAPFDPGSIEDSHRMTVACLDIANRLVDKGEKVIVYDTGAGIGLADNANLHVVSSIDDLVAMVMSRGV